MDGVPIVAFDEAGNTGDHLLDEEQPIYTLASVLIDEPAAASLVRETLPRQLHELRYTRLRTSPAGRAAIEQVLASELITSQTARVTPVHKPFMVVAKLFDNLMEPTFFDHGIEIRDGIANVAAANLLYRSGPRACGAAPWRELLGAFVAASRRPQEETLERLARAHRACRLRCTELRVRQFLDLVPTDEEALLDTVRAAGFEEIGNRELLDPAWPTLLENLQAWIARVGRIVVVHDDTPLIRRFGARLYRLIRAEGVDEYGPWLGFDVPLAVDEFRLVSSRETPEVQIADVVAGACVTYLNEQVAPGGVDAPFAAVIAETVLPELIENPIWPEPLSPLRRF